MSLTTVSFFHGMILKHKECSTEISIEVNHLNH